MSESRTELVLRVAADFNRQRFQTLREHATPDVVFDWSNSIGPQRGVFQGTDEVLEWLNGFLEAWDEITWNPEEVIELGHEHVLFVNRVRARGKGSGVEVDALGAQLWTLREGRLARARVFQNREEGLRAWRFDRIQHARLYLVCESTTKGGYHAPIEEALSGGADVLQLRDKDLPDEELVAAAGPFRRAAAKWGALFILNDRPDLVTACDADGVHVGQEDLPVEEARRLAGTDAIVGLSTHTPDQLDAACSADGDSRPDYLSVGPVWATPTKPRRPATGLDYVRHAATHCTLPWFAIGGIDASNVAAVLEAGARRIVVVRAIRDADDPEKVARALRMALDEAAGIG